MLYSVESIRDGIACLAGDDGSTLQVPAAALAPELRPGDVAEPGEDGLYRPCPEETRRRAARARALFHRLRG